MKVYKDTKVLDRLIRDNPDNLSKFNRTEAAEMVNDIKLSMPPSPSAPGEPPGVDTNALRESVRQRSEGKFREIIEDGVLYGIVHELGDTTHPPRPFMVPIFEKYRKRYAEDAKRWGLLK